MWRNHAARILALCGGIVAGSAAAGSVEEAMQHVNASLARVPHLSDADLLSDEGGQRYAAARRFVFEKQCSSGRANPLVLTSLPLKVNLKGSVAQDGSVRISAMDSGQFEIPLRLSTVADFPKEYLKEMAALIETKGVPREVVDRLSKELPQNYERLVARLQGLIDGFDPRTCPRRPTYTLERSRYTIFVPPTF